MAVNVTGKHWNIHAFRSMERDQDYNYRNIDSLHVTITFFLQAREEIAALFTRWTLLFHVMIYYQELHENQKNCLQDFQHRYETVVL